MILVVKVVLARRFFAELTPRTVRDNCAFCKCSGRGTRPLLRLGPVPRPHVISGNRTSLQVINPKLNYVFKKDDHRWSPFLV
mgnify:CR=1 FL=1